MGRQRDKDIKKLRKEGGSLTSLPPIPAGGRVYSDEQNPSYQGRPLTKKEMEEYDGVSLVLWLASCSLTNKFDVVIW